jgi:hypothetical protein
MAGPCGPNADEAALEGERSDSTTGSRHRSGPRTMYRFVFCSAKMKWQDDPAQRTHRDGNGCSVDAPFSKLWTIMRTTWFLLLPTWFDLGHVPDARAATAIASHDGTHRGLVGQTWDMAWFSPPRCQSSPLPSSADAGPGIRAATAKPSFGSDLRPQYPPTLVQATSSSARAEAVIALTRRSPTSTARSLLAQSPVRRDG